MSNTPKAEVNAPIEAVIVEAVRGLFSFNSTTHYRSPAGYVSYASRLGPRHRGAAVSVIATPKPGGIRFAVVLMDWSNSSSGMKSVDHADVSRALTATEDPTKLAAEIREAVIRLTTQTPVLQG